MTTILSTACFNLGVLGTRLTQDFSTRISKLGINHKQVGILALIDAHNAHSQRELASHLRVAPSLVVSLIDQLVFIGAVTRQRSETDRRIQVITITKEGKRLLSQAEAMAKELDKEFRASLPASAQQALDTLLAAIKLD